MPSSNSNNNSINFPSTFGQASFYKSKVGISILVLTIVYIVGIIGILSEIDQRFIYLTPVNLLFSLFIILFNHKYWKPTHLVYMFICFLVGFLSEVLGVNTGLIFGSYYYGEVLGLKLWETPLIIGVNWLMLVYASSTTVNHLLKNRAGLFIKALLAAAIMVTLDFLIEPVAISLGFWFWTTPDIPLQNYLGWFAIAFVLCLGFHFFLKDNLNFAAVALLILQFIFFFCIGFF